MAAGSRSSRIFTAKVTRMRVTWSPFTPTQMLEIGDTALKSILSRISQAQDVNDSPAKPLSDRYIQFKVGKKGKAPIRDWFLRGVLVRSLKVKSASQEKVTLGPVTVEANSLVTFNQRRCRQWGVSPRDLEAIRLKVRQLIVGKSVLAKVKVA